MGGNHEGEAQGMALTALHRIDAHEQLCAERYKQIGERHDEVKRALDEMAGKVSRGFSSLYNRLWTALLALVAIELSIIGFFIVKFVIK